MAKRLIRIEVLNKNFQETLHVSKQWSTLLQTAYFGAYFVTALPAACLCKSLATNQATQVGVAALFINYCTEQKLGISNQFASYLLSASLVLFTVGRFTGTALMKKIAAHRLLAIYAAAAMGLGAIVVWGGGVVGVAALMAIFFFASIMFPTIFALGIADLGPQTKTAASFIIMSIVGGAVMPLVIGALAQSCGTPSSYVVPMGCFLVVLLFAVHGYRVRSRENRFPILSD